MKKTSILQLYCFTMICHIFMLICGISGIIIMLIYSNDFINSIGKILGIIFIIVIICMFLILIIISLNVIVTLLMDLKSLRSKNFITIIGKVIKFKKNIEPESGAQINDSPVVLILETNEKIGLVINDKIMVGETYKFNYLKNSKIAEIVEKIENK